MQRRLSFWALLATVVLVGLLFFRVISPFLAPLFFAGVLAMLLYPIYESVAKLLGGRRRGAACVTVLALGVVFVPLSAALVIAGREVMEFGSDLSPTDLADHPAVRRGRTFVRNYFPKLEWEQLQNSFISGLQTTTREVFQRTQSLLSNVVTFLVALAVMGLSLYYFMADGPQLLRQFQQLSPLDADEEARLLDEFARVCRGIVAGTVVCALAQAALLAVGLTIAGVERVWLLSGLTVLLAMIPYLGSAGVWVPVTGWLLWQGEYGSAVFLGIYGAAVVSTSDNLIRAHVLHESAHMHPLLALISALGGLRLVGLWGIFLGPIVAALFYTLLKMLHDRLAADAAAGDDRDRVAEQ